MIWHMHISIYQHKYYFVLCRARFGSIRKENTRYFEELAYASYQKNVPIDIQNLL
jgi:hypothetical protein